jgi:Zn-dependent protease with chaperone function
MSMLSLNEVFVFACVATITGAPFYFRYWLKRDSSVFVDSVDKMTSRLSTLIFVALFMGAFVFNDGSRKTGEILLGAAILSFSFLYQSRFRFQQIKAANPLPKADPESRLRDLALLSVVAGILFAMTYSPYFMPLMLVLVFRRDLILRLRYKNTKMAESKLKLEFKSIFLKAGTEIKEVFVINEGARMQNNAMIAGKSLFITLDLFEKLDEIELKAVVSHEASHLKLGHPLKRIFAAVGTMMLAFFWFFFPVSLHFQGNYAVFFGVVPLIVVVQGYLFGKIVRRQELEADLGALYLGASSTALISALEKLSPVSKNTSSPRRLYLGVTYPTTAERIKVIRAGELPDAARFQYKKYAWAYSLLVIGYSFHVVQTAQFSAQRSLASVQAKGANIAHLEPANSDRQDQ